MKVEKESILGPLLGNFRWINEKKTVVTSTCRGIFNTRQGNTAFKQEQAMAIHNNMDDSHTQNVEWRKPDTKEHMLYESSYTKLKTGKLT